MTKKYIRGNQDIDTSLLSLEMMWFGINDKRMQDQIGILAPDSYLEVINGRTINYCIEQESAAPFIYRCADSIINNPSLLKMLKEKTISITDDMQSYARELFPITGSMKNNEISQALEKIHFLQAECGLHGAVIAFADFYGGITDRLLEIVMKRKNLSYPVHIYTSVLGTPYEKSLTQQAYDDIREGHKDDDQLLREYFWLGQGYIGRGLNNDDSAKIKNSNPPEHKIFSVELEKELSLSDQEKTIFVISQDIIFTKALRADVRQFLYVVMNKLVDSLGKQWGVDSKYIEALYSNELVEIINGKITFPENIEERYERAVYIPTDSELYEVRIGKVALEFVNTHFAKEEILKDEALKGQVAHPGIVRGKVKLVFGPQHNDKVNEGDILVSSATSPQLLPAMKRAAAFVTDVGGITSHAAIVARELKIPCIVGTKYATQILQDGDLVEVDANEGIVRRIDG
ncbi:MAG: PEP-utilizing enzyme [bacterium]|nr:PEP-utilizing enzyme [bacterium]